MDPNDPNASPVTQDLLDVLTYSTGVAEANDVAFRPGFPFVQLPWDGTEPAAETSYLSTARRTSRYTVCQ
ncbi:MAG: hypothetical protein R3C61_02965 [Bacteroidia bacterium]